MMSLFRKTVLFHHKYRKRCRGFYSSSIAGLFTGAMISILFSLITDIEFNRWINLFSYEFFAGLVYFAFTGVILTVFYFLGKGAMFSLLYIFKVSNKKDELISFRINYLAGIYAASLSTSLVILSSNWKIMLTVGFIFIIFYFPLEYFTIRNKNR